MLPTVLEALDRFQALFERDQRQKTRGTSQVSLESLPEVCRAKRKSSFHTMIHSGRFLEVFRASWHGGGCGDVVPAVVRKGAEEPRQKQTG
jgi:hypothetical protein